MSEYDDMKADKRRMEARERRRTFSELCAAATTLAMESHQVAGEKGDYFITLAQLNDVAIGHAQQEHACVLCGHNDVIDGLCSAIVPFIDREPYGGRACCCRCRFPSQTRQQQTEANFTLILRAYNGRITGAAPGDSERDLVDSEIEPARQLLAVFAGERVMRDNVSR